MVFALAALSLSQRCKRREKRSKKRQPRVRCKSSRIQTLFRDRKHCGAPVNFGILGCCRQTPNGKVSSQPGNPVEKPFSSNLAQSCDHCRIRSSRVDEHNIYTVCTGVEGTDRARISVALRAASQRGSIMSGNDLPSIAHCLPRGLF